MELSLYTLILIDQFINAQHQTQFTFDYQQLNQSIIKTNMSLISSCALINSVKTPSAADEKKIVFGKLIRSPITDF